jgi:hypothetical protein
MFEFQVPNWLLAALGGISISNSVSSSVDALLGKMLDVSEII